MRFSFPITKTEKLEDGRLLIEGVATSEALDSQGDILDYEGSKAAFAKWRGNLREAHDPKKPVGKALEVMPDDGEKSISVRAFVSAGAKDTQEKVLDGTLAMFSVGGDAPKRTKTEKVGGKLARRVLDWDMVELSLVDVGANPDAAFTLAKGMEASDAISECDTAKACDMTGHAEMSPEEHAKAHEEAPAEKAAEPESPAEVKAEEPGPVELPAELPSEKAAAAEVKKYDGMAAVDIRLALDCLAMLEQLKSLESSEAAEGKPEPPKQMKALVAACAALKEFIASEAQELLEVLPKTRGVILFKSEQTVDLDALVAKIAALLPIQKSDASPSPATAPEPDVRIDALLSNVSELQKTVGDLNAVTGEVKAIRDEVKKTAEGIDKILAQPVPGRAPVRMALPMDKAAIAAAPTMIDREMAWRQANTPEDKARALVDLNHARMACGLPAL